MSKDQKPLRKIFNEAVEIADAQQRAEYLAAACGVDVALRQRIEELIAADAESGRFLGGVGDTIAKAGRSSADTSSPLPAFGHPLPSDGRGAGGEGRTFGDYELLEEIARGGMGIVYRARQVSLDRIVAVKLLLLGQYASEEFIHRFRIEASAAASLQHPNIVAIHEVGVHQGQHYFAMDFVDGPDLAQIVRDGPLTAKRAAGYVKTIAEAIHFAHTRRILHRDLKPSNVLIDSNDHPRVTDFGLAKNLGNDSELTLTGQVMGSPGFMPPEQALGERGKMGPGSDVYSLGAILYHALTGRAPFVGQTVNDTLQQVQNKEPIAPRLLAPGVPVDLETICLKCLQKESARRFASAQALADELGRFLRDEPIHARPVSRAEHAWRWCRRQPALAGLSAAVLLLLVAVAVGSSVAALRIRNEVLRVKSAEEAGREKLWQSYLDQARAGRWSGRAGRRFDSLEALAKAADIRPTLELRNEAIACMTLVDVRLARHWTNEFPGQRMGADRPMDRYAASDAAGNIQLRRAQDDQPILQLKTPGAKVERILQFSHQGQHLAVAYRDSRIRVWDLVRREIVLNVPVASGLERFGLKATDPLAVDFSPDDRQLAVASGTRGAVIYPLDPAQETQTFVVSQGVYFVRFDPTGKKLAVACAVNGGKVLILDLESQTVGSTLLIGEIAFGFDWHPDGRHLVMIDPHTAIAVFDTITGQRGKGMDGLQPQVVKFGSAGDFLVSSGWDGKHRFWSHPGAEPLVSVVGAGSNLQISPDERKLTCSAWGGDEIALYEVAPGRELRKFHAPTPQIGKFNKPVAFIPAGDWLAYGPEDKLTLRDTSGGREVDLEAGRVLSLSFNQEGKFLYASGDLGLFRWPLQLRLESGEWVIGPRETIGPRGQYLRSCLSADGRIFAAIQGDRCRLFDTETLAEIARTDLQSGLNQLALSPDGQWLATGLWHRNGVGIFNARTGKLIHTLPTPGSSTVAFTPDGHWVVTSSAGECRFWETESWAPGLRIKAIEGDDDVPGQVAFSADGKMMALSHRRNLVHLIDPATGEVLGALEHPDSAGITSFSFTGDGSQLAVGGTFHECFVWDLRAIRAGLRRINLDWNAPAFAPESKTNSASRALVVLPSNPATTTKEQ